MKKTLIAMSIAIWSVSLNSSAQNSCENNGHERLALLAIKAIKKITDRIGEDPFVFPPDFRGNTSTRDDFYHFHGSINDEHSVSMIAICEDGVLTSQSLSIKGPLSTIGPIQVAED